MFYFIIERGSRAFYNPVDALVIVDDSTTDDSTTIIVSAPSVACNIAVTFAVICTVVLAHFI